MVNKQQEAKDGLVWLEKYIEQLEAERDYLDAKCAELEEKLLDAESKSCWIPQTPKDGE